MPITTSYSTPRTITSRDAGQGGLYTTNDGGRPGYAETPSSQRVGFDRDSYVERANAEYEARRRAQLAAQGPQL